MGNRFAEIAFTDAVKEAQETFGSRRNYARMERLEGSTNDRLGPSEAAFIAARDSAYIATVSETGWPYIQHRGGPPGFVRALDEKTIGFADYVGNLTADQRMSMIFMDYPNRTRLKLLGRARIVGLEDRATLEKLETPSYRARVERGVLVTVEAFDWNCPQHIVQRFTLAEVERIIAPLLRRVGEPEEKTAG
jgi:predicted pyridoxine 5'-phosphate oxidase superfamily flavin-nucleotide-binding protein